MQDVAIKPMDMDRVTGLFGRERRDRFEQTAATARRLLDGRVVWNVNATAHGGGVAEMLQTLLGYVRGVGVDTRWSVLSGPPEFFVVTKRIHNLLHGEAGDGGPLGGAESEVVAAAWATNLAELSRRVRPRDVVVLHDPQTAGMVDGLRAAGALVVWRCHIGRDTTNRLTDRGWTFLRPLLENADAFVFSRRTYAPDWIPPQKVHVITPSIDPFSPKNCPLSDVQVRATLSWAGLVEGEVATDAVTSARPDGTTGGTRLHTGLLLDGPALPASARFVLQVSRWDRLKDMSGLLTGFAASMDALPDDVHLVLAGPEVSGVSDDPEGALVLAECRDLWRGLEARQRRRVHLVCLPMENADENAHLVNALQRRASVVVQKSLVEGFGLTVTEAMWKGRPIVASAIGGILDQIVDGQQGVLLQDPQDIPALGRALGRLLHDPALVARLGAAAHERVLQGFLGDRQLESYVELLTELSQVAGGAQAVPATSTDHLGHSVPPSWVFGRPLDDVSSLDGHQPGDSRHQRPRGDCEEGGRKADAGAHPGDHGEQ
jgi:trehalose synthase